MNHSRSGRVALIVLDGVGIGAAPDAEEYGDAGSDTLGNVARAVGGLDLPYLDALGLGCCRPLDGMGCSNPKAAHGIAVPESLGKDSITGHWELCGVILDRPFPVYPNGFPTEVVDRFAQATGRAYWPTGSVGHRRDRRIRRRASRDGCVDSLYVGRQRFPDRGPRGADSTR